jgi:DNA-binding NarL/FixJ family response regulator
VIRVLIADDQALFREGLHTVLVAQGIDVVGEAADGEEAARLATELAPDVVLMDLRMPGLDGVAATRRIAQLPRGPRVIALTTFDDDESVFEALRAGAIGYQGRCLVHAGRSHSPGRARSIASSAERRGQGGQRIRAHRGARPARPGRRARSLRA